jgi:hypothetical protein
MLGTHARGARAARDDVRTAHHSKESATRVDSRLWLTTCRMRIWLVVTGAYELLYLIYGETDPGAVGVLKEATIRL